MENKEKTKKNRVLREIFEWLLALGIAVAVALLLTQVIFVNAQVPTGSMENTIRTGDRVLGYRLSYLRSEPERLDIVMFRYPDDPSELYVKRVIGLPGDTVELRDGRVYLNGAAEPLDEPYVTGKPDGRGDGIYEVPEGHYFVMGDNRNNSHDSRFWINTFLPEGEIIGKAVLRLWPSPETLK